jgi:hypothetical protein
MVDASSFRWTLVLMVGIVACSIGGCPAIGITDDWTNVDVDDADPPISLFLVFDADERDANAAPAAGGQMDVIVTTPGGSPTVVADRSVAGRDVQAKVGGIEVPATVTGDTGVTLAVPAEFSTGTYALVIRDAKTGVVLLSADIVIEAKGDAGQPRDATSDAPAQPADSSEAGAAVAAEA